MYGILRMRSGGVLDIKRQEEYPVGATPSCWCYIFTLRDWMSWGVGIRGKGLRLQGVCKICVLSLGSFEASLQKGVGLLYGV